MKTLCVALSLSLFSVLALAQDSVPITKSHAPGSIQWTQYGFLATHTSFNSHETILTRANVARLTFQWAGEVGSISSAPVVGHGIVYAAADGMIFAFRASDGTPLWSHLSCTGMDTAQPALGPHALLVGDGGGDMAAYDPVTGDTIWCDDISGSITSAPAVDEKTVYFTDGFEVVALDQLTGAQLWRFAPSDFIPLTSAPAVFDGVVFVTGGNSVFALDKTTGNELWRTDLGPDAGISSAPSVAGNTVYVGGFGLFALRASDGHLRWSADVGVNVSMPAIANNKVFVNSEDPLFGLWAFDANTGALLWRNEKPGEPESTLTVANGVIFDIAEFGDLMMFNSATGAFLGSIVDPEGHQSQPRDGRPQPAVVNGVVYYPTSDRVDAFRLPSAPGGVPTGTCVYQKIPFNKMEHPSDINDIGAIVGSVPSLTESPSHAFLLFGSKETLFRFPGAQATTAFSINNHAQIGGSFTTAAGNNRGYVVRDGVFHAIVVPNSKSNDVADINDKGDIVGSVTTNDGVAKGYLLHNGIFHIFRFPGSAETAVGGINEDAIIVGNYRSAVVNSPIHGFMVKNGVFTTLNFPGAQNTFPIEINDEGDIVGFFVRPTGLFHGFLFHDGKFRELNDPPNSQQNTPVGINNHDQIVTGEGFKGDCHAAF